MSKSALVILFLILSAVVSAKVCYIVGHASCETEEVGTTLHFMTGSSYKTGYSSCRPQGYNREYANFIARHSKAYLMRRGCKNGKIQNQSHRYWTYESNQNNQANSKLEQLFYGCKRDNKYCVQLDGEFNPYNY